MWVEQVEALAFGPFQNETLQFPCGMTLVFGPNEAGKSSWHGALYAAVCGIRRARGRQAISDQEFEAKHRPWDGGPWRVRAVIELSDGMHVELTQDLAHREGTAIDRTTGKDLGSAILKDQVPDASRWLGLNRDAFRAVACVPQTAMLQIRQQPKQIAEHLQRAAATAGTDATAAEAIRRIDTFLTDQVGTERAWKKPLAIARNDLNQAEETLRLAKRHHEDHARLRERLRNADEAMESAEHRLRVAEAVEAQARARSAANVWDQASELSVKYPEPPRPLAADDTLAQRARAAAERYRNRPAVPALEGPSSSELETALVALPSAPTGDTAPVSSVQAAYDAVRDAKASLRSVSELRPSAVVGPDRTPTETGELRRLADAIADPLPDTSADQQQDRSSSTDNRPPTRRKLLRAAAVSAAVLVVAGVAVAIVSRQPTGWIAVAAGAVTGAGLLIAILRGHARQIAALTDLQESRTAQAARMAAEQRISSARSRVVGLGLLPDPAALRDLADQGDRARASAAQYADWQSNQERAQAGFDQSLENLSLELSARDTPVTPSPEDGYHRYLEDCRHRHAEAQEAGRRHGLESQLRDRRQAEKQAAEASDRRSTAEQELRAAASATGLYSANTADPDGAVAAIEDWLDQREKEIGVHQQSLTDYAVLQELLSGGTLDDLRAEADRLSQAFATAAEGIDAPEFQGTDLGPDPAAALRRLREEARNTRDEVTQLRTTVQNQEEGITSVAVAEETLAQKADHVRRLERLSTILGRSRTFLVQAQENVHRSIAPQLAEAIAPHLGAVTAGRYTDVTVNPEDLQVKVRAPSGAWREADRLSHGTAEQVYILLRAALAQYLVTSTESCPLIFDDPTAYADDPRTVETLRVLHHLSAERQVIIFSHDTQVLAWARASFQSPRDKIIELPGLPVS